MRSVMELPGAAPLGPWRDRPVAAPEFRRRASPGRSIPHTLAYAPARRSMNIDIKRCMNIDIKRC